MFLNGGNMRSINFGIIPETRRAH